jgi:hypothetical protein
MKPAVRPRRPGSMNMDMKVSRGHGAPRICPVARAGSGPSNERALRPEKLELVET